MMAQQEAAAVAAKQRDSGDGGLLRAVTSLARRDLRVALRRTGRYAAASGRL